MNVSRRFFTAGTVAALTLGRAVAAQPKIRVLIVDGINNHDWKTATHAISAILTAAGSFSVDVSTTPPAEAEAFAWDAWRPNFTRYDAVIVNWNAGDSAKALQWPAEVEASLDTFVRRGGGMVSFHAANNALSLWPAYNRMIGLGWRPPTFGPGIRIDDDDTVVVIPQGEGHRPGHPAMLDFQVHVRDTHHPITAGMPQVWMHPLEQLTHGQHGPAEGLTILTYAHSPVTLQNEPMDWVCDYGKGRVYTTMLGHTWVGDPCPNLDCVGFQTLLTRGVEWAAMGRVTTAIPADFPGPERISLHKLS